MQGQRRDLACPGCKKPGQVLAEPKNLSSQGKDKGVKGLCRRLLWIWQVVKVGTFRLVGWIPSGGKVGDHTWSCCSQPCLPPVSMSGPAPTTSSSTSSILQSRPHEPGHPHALRSSYLLTVYQHRALLKLKSP